MLAKQAIDLSLPDLRTRTAAFLLSQWIMQRHTTCIPTRAQTAMMGHYIQLEANIRHLRHRLLRLKYTADALLFVSSFLFL